MSANNQPVAGAMLPDALADVAYVYKQTVAWGDMDAFAHLNNVIYHRYAESARIAYLSTLELLGDAYLLLLAHGSCDYLKPVEFPDELYIGVQTQKVGNASLVLDYLYYSTAQQALVAKASSVLVRIHKETQQKAQWNEAERQSLLNASVTHL